MASALAGAGLVLLAIFIARIPLADSAIRLIAGPEAALAGETAVRAIAGLRRALAFAGAVLIAAPIVGALGWRLLGHRTQHARDDERRWAGLAEVALAAGSCLLIVVLSTQLAIQTGFFLGYSLPVWALPLGVVCGVATWQVLVRSAQAAVPAKLRVWSGACLVLWGFVAWGAGQWFIDLSWDGQSYHQEAIHLLAGGWNPLRGGSGNPGAVFIDHYPRGAEIFQAAFFKTTGAIEGGKALNWLLMGAAGCISFAALARPLSSSKRLAVLLSLLAACNPVSVYQLTSFYVDGALASILTCLFALIFMQVSAPSGRLLVPLVACVILATGIKFTGLVYAAVFCAGLVLATLAKTKNLRAAARLATGLAAVCVFAVGVMGADTYVRNYVDHGHPFYPVFGAQRVDIMAAMIPDDFKPENRVVRLVRANLSEASTEVIGRTRWKLPFDISLPELATYRNADTRIGGLGPWFGFAFLGAMLLFAVQWRSVASGRRWLGAALVLLLVSVLLNPECWWARYAPQFYLVPLIVIAWGAGAANTAARWIRAGCVLVLGVSLLLVAAIHLSSQALFTIVQSAQLDAVAAVGRPVALQAEEFPANRFWFDRRHIAYQLGPPPPGHASFSMINRRTRISFE